MTNIVVALVLVTSFLNDAEMFVNLYEMNEELGDLYNTISCVFLHINMLGRFDIFQCQFIPSLRKM